MSALTYSTVEVADLLGVSPWGLYESIRRDEAPFPFVRVGRRIVWPRRPVDEALGISMGGRTEMAHEQTQAVP